MPIKTLTFLFLSQLLLASPGVSGAKTAEPKRSQVVKEAYRQAMEKLALHLIYQSKNSQSADEFFIKSFQLPSDHPDALLLQRALKPFPSPVLQKTNRGIVMTFANQKSEIEMSDQFGRILLDGKFIEGLPNKTFRLQLESLAKKKKQSARAPRFHLFVPEAQALLPLVMAATAIKWGVTTLVGGAAAGAAVGAILGCVYGGANKKEGESLTQACSRGIGPIATETAMAVGGGGGLGAGIGGALDSFQQKALPATKENLKTFLGESVKRGGYLAALGAVFQPLTSLSERNGVRFECSENGSFSLKSLDSGTVQETLYQYQNGNLTISEKPVEMNESALKEFLKKDPRFQDLADDILEAQIQEILLETKKRSEICQNDPKHKSDDLFSAYKDVNESANKEFESRGAK